MARAFRTGFYPPLLTMNQPLQKAILALALSILCSTSLLATYAPYHPRFYPGYLLLKNGDSLSGEILIPQLNYSLSSYRSSDQIFVRTVDSATRATKVTGFRRSDIAFVRAYYRVVYIRGIAYSRNYSPEIAYDRVDSATEPHTDYKNISYLGHTYLARLLASGKADVYDLFQNPEKEITDRNVNSYVVPIYNALFFKSPVLIFKGDTVERIPTRFTLQLRRSRFLLRFINKRYGMHLPITAFTSNPDMFRYIAARG
jgi:hypothetical protein